MWFIAGGIAFIAVIFNFILVLNDKHKYCSLLVWVSLSGGLVAMSSMYSLINSWVQEGDMSALMDVVPTMNNVLIGVILIGIILNAIVVFLHHKKRPK